MKLLITGGTGLIGRALIAHFLQNGERDITVLTRDKNAAAKHMADKVSGIDLSCLTFVEHLDDFQLCSNTVVINLAGEPIADKRWTTTQKQRICQSRWQITEMLADHISQSEQKPAVFISGSAIGIYGRQGQTPIDESFRQYYPEFSHQICQKWEQIALALAQQTRVVTLRTGIVLAKEGGALAKMILPFKLGLGGKVASGEQGMSWIHIDDMVAAICHIIITPSLTGAVNLTAPQPVSNLAFSQAFAKQLARPCLLTTPEFFLRIAFGELADLLIYGQFVMPKKLDQSGYTFTYRDIDKAFASLY